MLDSLSLLSKAITAMVTSLIMLRLKEHFHVSDLDISSQLQTVVELSTDIVMSGIVTFFVWFIPFGKKYVHDRIIGTRVIITNTSTGLQSVGEVTQVIPETKQAQ